MSEIFTLKGAPAGSVGGPAVIKRVSAQFDKTNATLANVTGLSVSVVASGVYAFRATLYTTQDVTGLAKYAIAGTCTATAIRYTGFISDTTTAGGTTTGIGTATALAGTITDSSTSVSGGTTVVNGTITVNAAGTLTVQFAQNGASGTSSVLVGSTFEVTRIA